MNIRKEVNIGELIQSDYNPRKKIVKGSSDWIDISDSIDAYGLVEPLVVNEVNMHVVGGNQRLEVLKEKGVEKVDCVFVHIEDEAKEKALCIALNKIDGEWDEEILWNLLEDDEVLEFPTGFDDAEIELYAPEMDIEDDIEEIEPDAENEVQEDRKCMVIIGGYKFSVKEERYYKLVGRLRDKGLFTKEEITGEILARIQND